MYKYKNKIFASKVKLFSNIFLTCYARFPTCYDHLLTEKLDSPTDNIPDNRFFKTLNFIFIFI